MSCNARATFHGRGLLKPYDVDALSAGSHRLMARVTLYNGDVEDLSATFTTDSRDAPPDSTPPDSTPPDSTPPDSTPPDSTPPDSTPPDSTPPTRPSAGDGIRIYAANPFYWQYDGRPVLLLGGAVHSNLFHVDNLAAHLDEIEAAGGNYLRCTMSQRKVWNIDDVGIERPYATVSGGKFDLDRWNSVYWNDFAKMLRLAKERGMIVQVELWDRWGYIGGSWSDNAFNPANNVNYTSAQSGLDSVIDKPRGDAWMGLAFFNAVPALDNNTLLLNYQRAFVRKVLSYTLPYDNVLYTVGNESTLHEQWAKYWASFVKDEASAAGESIYITQMFDDWDLRSARQHIAYDNPRLYAYVDLSQNSTQKDQTHWDRLQYARDQLRRNPRPMNHTKTYGANTASKNWASNDAQAVERFWRNIIGGAATVRFHRPDTGIGIKKPAKSAIAAARKLESLIALWDVEPRQDLLSSRASDEAYLAASAGSQYALYFTRGGAVGLKLGGASADTFTLRWISVQSGAWGSTRQLDGNQTVTISAPSAQGWIAAIVKNR